MRDLFPESCDFLWNWTDSYEILAFFFLNKFALYYIWRESFTSWDISSRREHVLKRVKGVFMCSGYLCYVSPRLPSPSSSTTPTAPVPRLATRTRPISLSRATAPGYTSLRHLRYPMRPWRLVRVWVPRGIFLGDFGACRKILILICVFSESCFLQNP